MSSEVVDWRYQCFWPLVSQERKKEKGLWVFLCMSLFAKQNAALFQQLKPQEVPQFLDDSWLKNRRMYFLFQVKAYCKWEGFTCSLKDTHRKYEIPPKHRGFKIWIERDDHWEVMVVLNQFQFLCKWSSASTLLTHWRWIQMGYNVSLTTFVFSCFS